MQPQSTVSAKCPGKARNEEQNLHPTAPGCPMDLLLSEQMAILQLVARLKKKKIEKNPTNLNGRLILFSTESYLIELLFPGENKRLFLVESCLFFLF